MEALDHCPLCAKSLELQQINFKMAVLICLDVKCPYPTESECIVVRRKIEHINKQVDLYAELKKQEQSQAILSNSKQSLESNLMLELEDLLNSHNNSALVINSGGAAEDKELQNIKSENSLRDQQSSVVDIDEFLDNLLS